MLYLLYAVLKQLSNARVWNVAAVLDHKHKFEDAVEHVWAERVKEVQSTIEPTWTCHELRVVCHDGKHVFGIAQCCTYVCMYV